MKRPNCPQAAHVMVCFCSNPECGPHLIAVDADDKPICELVLSRKGTPQFAQDLLDALDRNPGIEQLQ